MATAYLAVQESLDRRAVLKVLKTSRQNAEENVERFRNEARIIASLNHPHVVTIYDIGLAEGCLYISMEYVEGGDLRARIKQTVPAEQALNIIRKIGAGSLRHTKKASFTAMSNPVISSFAKTASLCSQILASLSN